MKKLIDDGLVANANLWNIGLKNLPDDTGDSGGFVKTYVLELSPIIDCFGVNYLVGKYFFDVL
jgi:hypothetical protein